MVLHEVAVVELQRQRPARVPSADEHDIFHPGGMGHMADFFLGRSPKAVGKPYGNGANEADQIPNHHTGTGHQEAVKVEQCHTKHRQYQIGADDAKNLGGAYKGPDTAVQPEAHKHNHGNGAPGADGGQEACQMLRADFLKGKVVAKPQAKEKGTHGGDHVQCHNQQNFGQYRYIQETGSSDFHFHSPFVLPA